MALDRVATVGAAIEDLLAILRLLLGAGGSSDSFFEGAAGLCFLFREAICCHTCNICEEKMYFFIFKK